MVANSEHLEFRFWIEKIIILLWAKFLDLLKRKGTSKAKQFFGLNLGSVNIFSNLILTRLILEKKINQLTGKRFNLSTMAHFVDNKDHHVDC